MQTETMPNTNYMGSRANFESVKKQLAERYGQEVADSYDPFVNCRTYADWKTNNYLVNKGARSFRSVVIIEKKDPKTGKTTKIPKTICLFFRNQVRKIVE